jgi:hypothetical protein
MPYGKVSATVAEADNGRELTIRVQLPAAGEPAKSGNSDNLTDPNEWTDVVDEFWDADRDAATAQRHGPVSPRGAPTPRSIDAARELAPARSAPHVTAAVRMRDGRIRGDSGRSILPQGAPPPACGSAQPSARWA